MRRDLHLRRPLRQSMLSANTAEEVRMHSPPRGAAAGRRGGVLLAAAATAVVATTTGCAGPSPEITGARDAATTFGRAVADGDAEAACGLLARSVVESLEQSDGSCPQGVQQAGLDDPGELTGSEVWGSSGLVTFTGGDVFLTVVDGRWRVTAAGCTQHEESPADCDLEEG
jgi:hypothetical protein